VKAFLRWFERELNPSAPEISTLEKLAQQWTEPSRQSTVQQTWDTLQHDDEDISWADRLRFGELPFGAQRLTLFLRALLASPDLIILDEALSGVDEAARAKAFLFLAHGEKFSAIRPETEGLRPSIVAEVADGVCFEGLDDRQALLVISHARTDVPGCVREWICLPEPGERRAPRMGTLREPLEIDPRGWEEIWGRDE
jgi:hypothetical protein